MARLLLPARAGKFAHVEGSGASPFRLCSQPLILNVDDGGILMAHLQRDTWRILLIDENPFKQNLRATILRNYEIEVHTATTFPDAQSLWINNLYDLILLAAAENSPEALTLPAQIRLSKPRQRIGLLVGAPTYVREVGGIPKRVHRVSPPPPSSFAPELIGAQTRPQWQEIVQRLVGS